jgi:cytochrome c oxidase assembly protein subunit 15
MDGYAGCRYQAGMAAIARLFEFSRPGNRAVGWWLLVVALFIAAMVTVGGLTRLTGSGLSITEWHPVTGAVPPLSVQAWQAEFAKYRHIPQYRLEHRGMSLGEFKSIYWWEWTHRLLGRLIGFVFLAPMLFFIATGAIARRAIPRMILLFALGGLQGFVGWWMVESGLETRVSVSQYRLAIHLGVALVLFVAILWTALEYLTGLHKRTTSFDKLGMRSTAAGTSNIPHARPVEARKIPIEVADAYSKRIAFGFTALVYLQMLLGALVAGLHAGLVYNTWPSMDGRVFPENAFFSSPWWINFFENAGLAQFDHRIGAYLLVVGAVWLWLRSRRQNVRIRTSADAVIGLTVVQVMLGVATLLNQAPVALAALHQATAVALLSAALWHAFEVSRFSQPAAARA